MFACQAFASLHPLAVSSCRPAAKATQSPKEAHRAAMSDDEKDNRTIREKVEEFIMSDNTIEEMEEFGKTHCNEFEDTEENKLVYTEIFNKFTQKFESKLTNFIEDQGSTLQEFSAQCKEELDNEDSQSIALELIMAITDFELFKSTMVDLKDPA